MTKRQAEIVKAMEGGAVIRGFISGWYWRNKKLRVETVDALSSLGVLWEFCPIGSRSGAGGSVICHEKALRDIVEKFDNQITSLKKVEPA